MRKQTELVMLLSVELALRGFALYQRDDSLLSALQPYMECFSFFQLFFFFHLLL